MSSREIKYQWKLTEILTKNGRRSMRIMQKVVSEEKNDKITKRPPLNIELEVKTSKRGSAIAKLGEKIGKKGRIPKRETATVQIDGKIENGDKVPKRAIRKMDDKIEEHDEISIQKCTADTKRKELTTFELKASDTE